MKQLGATPAVLSLFATSALVWIVASCAAQGGEPAGTGLDDGGSADSSSVITEPDAAALAACTDGRWCAVAPPVTGSISLNGVWGSGPSDVWLVGSPDVAIHWDGVAFGSTRLITDQTVFGIWGSGPTDVWAFSTGDVLWHNSGGAPVHSAWSALDKDAGPIDAGAADGGDAPSWTGPVYGMWGRSATDIWAVGRSVDGTLRTVWHCEGWNSGVPAWVSTATTPGATPWDADPSFNAVWGSALGEVWVVGEKGKTRYSPGWKDGAASWTVVDSGTSLPLHAVWGAGNGEVWAAGGGGTVRRFELQTDGTIAVQEVAFPSRATIRALTGFAANDIWAAGSEGMLAHWDGAAWSLVEVSSATEAVSNELFGAIWGSGPHDIWAAGRNILLHKGSTLLPGTMP